MPVLEDIVNLQAELVRKALVAAMFVAPDTATLPASLTVAGSNEVQTLTITGTATAGTFTLTYAGQTTTALAFNATAATIQTALEALSNLAPGDVVCTGGPLPGTMVTLTFGGTLAGTNVAQVTATSSLTGTAPAIVMATTTPGSPIQLAAVPSGYVSLGLVKKDGGFSFGNEWEMSEVKSLGRGDPVRRDILSNTSTMGFAAQETNKLTQSMFYNVDLSALVPTPVTGEVAFSKPLAPQTRYYRALLISQDGAGTDAIYMGALFPRAMVSETGEQTGSEDEEFAYPMTLTATPDTVAGYSARYMFGGPGWRSRLVAMGYPAAA